MMWPCLVKVVQGPTLAFSREFFTAAMSRPMLPVIVAPLTPWLTASLGWYFSSSVGAMFPTCGRVVEEGNSVVSFSRAA
jgi:hypothetical protein